MTEHTLETNGIRLHVVEAGPADGKLVLLLHGFPEFWLEWKYQIEMLAAAGYRVVAPDQRGYNLSDKPRGASSYTSDKIAADAVGIIRAYGREKALVVGHDWGGAIAWYLAAFYPEVIEKVVIINCPHPKTMLDFIKTSPAQMKKSWYIFVFLIPFLAEKLASANNFRMLRRALRPAGRAAYPDEDIEKYVAAWRQPGAITAMIDWYRGMLRKSTETRKPQKIKVPLLLIWGTKDQALGEEMVEPSLRRCENAKVHRLAGVSHWVPRQAPEKTTELLMNFFLSTPL